MDITVKVIPKSSKTELVGQLPDGTWKITARELVVQRWWIAEGYFPVPTDPTLARPA